MPALNARSVARTASRAREALLSGLTDDELGRRYDGAALPRPTDHTIADPAALRREVDQIRAQGFLEDREEFVLGVRCVAVPLRGRDGRASAAMGISAPAPRATAERLARGRRRLQAGAATFQRWLDGARDGRLAAAALAASEKGGAEEGERRLGVAASAIPAS